MALTLKDIKKIVIVLCLIGVSLPAQQKPLPAAKEIFAGYINACGGKKAFEAVKNRVTVSAIKNENTNTVTERTIYQAKPDKFYSVYTSPIIGKITSGVSGNIAWQISSVSGLKTIQGKEKETLLREAVMDKYVYWEKMFKKVELGQLTNLGDKYYYKVIATIDSGQVQNLYFDRESHLLVKIEMDYDYGSGPFKVEIFFSNYKKTGKILIPFRMQTQMKGEVLLTDIKSIKNNVKLSKKQFDLPDEIKRMLKK